MGYSFVLCRPTGEAVGELTEAHDRGLTRRLNGPAEARVVVDLKDPLSAQMAPGLARLKVYRAPTSDELVANPSATRTLVFYGSLPPNTIRDQAAEGTTTATFADPRWKFQWQYSLGTEVFTGTEQGDILWGLVNTQNARFGGAGETWLRQGSTATGVLRDRTYDRQTIAALFDAMSKVLDGPDVDVVPRDGYSESPATRIMGNLNVYLRQGQLRPNAKFLYLESGGGNVANMERYYEDIITYATLLGSAATGSNVPLSSTYGDPLSSLYGLHESYGTEQDITTQTLLDQRTRGQVEAFKVPRSVLTISGPTPEAPVALRDYDIGDTVYATCRKGALQVMELALRVHQIEINLSQEGREDVTLTTAEI